MSSNMFDPNLTLAPKQKKVLTLYLVSIAILSIVTSLIVEINNKLTPITLAMSAVIIASIIGGVMLAAWDAYWWRTKKSGYLPKGYQYIEGVRFTLKNADFDFVAGRIFIAVIALILGGILYFFELVLVCLLTNKIWFGFYDPLFWIIGVPAACANGMLVVELFLAVITKEYENRFTYMLKSRTPENWVINNRMPGFMDHQPSWEEAQEIWANLDFEIAEIEEKEESPSES